MTDKKNIKENPKDNSDNLNEEYKDYVLFLQSVQATPIKTLTDSLKDVINDINILFDKNGLQIKTTDPNRVTLVSLELKADKFDSYYCPNSEIVGVNMLSIHKLLKSIGNNDTLSLYIKKSNKEKLGIQIQNKKKGSNNKYEYNIMNVDYEILELPEVHPDVIVTMPCSDFQKYCREFSNIANFIKIYIESNGKLSFQTVDGNFAKQTLEIFERKNNNDNDFESNDITIQILEKIENNFIGTFPLKYLNLFCKSSGLCPNLQLYLKNDYPMFIVYDVGSLGKCTYGLLPRKKEIQEEEENLDDN